MPKTKTKVETKKTVKATKTAEEKPKKVVKTAKADASVQTAPEPGLEKKVIIDKFAVKTGDTGSPEVQVALLTNRIEKLIAHLKTNHSDNHSRRGLLGIVSKRRRLLNYLEKQDVQRYAELTGKLGLGK